MLFIRMSWAHTPPENQHNCISDSGNNVSPSAQSPPWHTTHSGLRCLGKRVSPIRPLSKNFWLPGGFSYPMQMTSESILSLSNARQTEGRAPVAQYKQSNGSVTSEAIRRARTAALLDCQPGNSVRQTICTPQQAAKKASVRVLFCAKSKTSI